MVIGEFVYVRMAGFRGCSVTLLREQPKDYLEQSECWCLRGVYCGGSSSWTSGTGRKVWYVDNVVIGVMRCSFPFVDDAVSVIQAITSSSAKPSFLLSERVYQKLSEDEWWLLRTTEALIRFSSKEISQNNAIRSLY